MSSSDKTPVTMQDLLVSSLAQTDALAKLLIEKGFKHSRNFSRRFQKNERPIKGCSSRHTNEDEPMTQLIEASSVQSRLKYAQLRCAESCRICCSHRLLVSKSATPCSRTATLTGLLPGKIFMLIRLPLWHTHCVYWARL